MLETILKDLKHTGLKITAPRREILRTLSTSPMSAQEVLETLKQKGFDVDLVTVYRTLELFLNLKLVHKIQFEDKTARYELVSNDDQHHHHLVCIKCGLVEDLIMDESNLIKQLENKSKFKVERHALEFFGFCQKCQDE